MTGIYLLEYYITDIKCEFLFDILNDRKYLLFHDIFQFNMNSS